MGTSEAGIVDLEKSDCMVQYTVRTHPQKLCLFYHWSGVVPFVRLEHVTENFSSGVLVSAGNSKQAIIYHSTGSNILCFVGDSNCRDQTLDIVYGPIRFSLCRVIKIFGNKKAHSLLAYTL